MAIGGDGAAVSFDEHLRQGRRIAKRIVGGEGKSGPGGDDDFAGVGLRVAKGAVAAVEDVRAGIGSDRALADRKIAAEGIERGEC